jgi:hypothetical protein
MNSRDGLVTSWACSPLVAADARPLDIGAGCWRLCSARRVLRRAAAPAVVVLVARAFEKGLV